MSIANTEDKRAWCERYGDAVEREFCVTLNAEGIGVWPNPAKRFDKYTHDLMTAHQSDLKTVRTPLFKARELYGIDPQYAITFNVKDGERYKERYPHLIVYFDIDWATLEKEIGGRVYRVRPMKMRVCGFMGSIGQAIKKAGKHRHTYERRRNDTTGNAKDSWVLDARDLHVIKREFI